MVYLKWFLRIILFIFLLGFSVKNLEPVTLNYFLGYQWHEPLVVILLAFTIMGMILGLLASMSTLFRLRRELQQLRRELKHLERPEVTREGSSVDLSHTAASVEVV